MEKMKVSCIIPTYNEGRRVLDVVNVVKGHPLLDEIIVVNDGSKDNTNELLRPVKGIKLVTHPLNWGKSFAVMEGIQEAKNPIIMLLDADLLGLTKQNITEIVSVVTSGEVDSSMSLRGNMTWIGRIIGFDFITGDRVFKKSLLGDIKQLASIRGFGLEVFINNKLIQNNCSIKIIRWPNVRSPWKYEKEKSIYQGLKGDLSMTIQIIRTVGIFGVLRQIWNIKKLEKR